MPLKFCLNLRKGCDKLMEIASSTKILIAKTHTWNICEIFKGSPSSFFIINYHFDINAYFYDILL